MTADVCDSDMVVATCDVLTETANSQIDGDQAAAGGGSGQAVDVNQHWIKDSRDGSDN